MSTRVVYDCDRCGVRDIGPRIFRSIHSSIPRHLCAECASDLLGKLMDGMGADQFHGFVEEIDSHPKIHQEES